MKLKITVLGVDYEVDVEVLEDDHGYAPAVPVVNYAAAPAPAPVTHAAPVVVTTPAPAPAAAPAGGGLAAPVSGTVIAVNCKAGDVVKRGQTLVTLDAMKMETKIASDRDGTVKDIPVQVSENVREGQLLVEFA
ncbi:MAG: biotin/lipoyl-binding protein [Deferribacteraceae bacterium]|nr:biotin/lipoyl-binding protein [Deferribacteraceae bacterium]